MVVVFLDIDFFERITLFLILFYWSATDNLMQYVFIADDPFVFVYLNFLIMFLFIFLLLLLPTWFFIHTIILLNESTIAIIGHKKKMRTNEIKKETKKSNGCQRFVSRSVSNAYCCVRVSNGYRVHNNWIFRFSIDLYSLCYFIHSEYRLLVCCLYVY